jgi:hypothetical protein
VFLSSDVNEFEKERKRLSQIICKIPFCSCIPLERRGAETTDVVEASLKATRNCDVYVGIFGRNYSETTIKEYREAVKHHKPCLCYVKKVNRRDHLLTEFVGNELASQFKYHEFNGIKNLYTQVESDLRKLIFETLKDGLKFRKSEKQKALQLINTGRKSVFAISPKAEPILEAQRAYEEENYLECVVKASIALERVLSQELAGKVAVGKWMTLGQLVNLATHTGLVDKNMAGSLLEISLVRNTVVHGMRTPDKKMALWVLQTVARVLSSLQK